MSFAGALCQEFYFHRAADILLPDAYLRPYPSSQREDKDNTMVTLNQPVVQKNVELLQDKAVRLRLDSVRATSAAGSGHPTSCASAAEIMAVLFFSVMRYDPKDPKNPANDVFVLS